MLSAADAIAAASAATWAYLVFCRGSFWRAGGEAREAKGSGPVVAIVPARNESGLIARSIGSLAAQKIPVILSDDESTDGTVAEARAIAPGLIVRDTGSRPAGWTGKMWAVHNGALEAARFNPRYVLLTDADIEHASDTVAQMIAIAEQGYDLVSWMAHLHCREPHEKALIPAFVFFFFMLYPPAWIRDRKRKTAGAAGGCMLVRFDALRRIGGIESIRNELIDDCALASRIKATGGNVYLGISKEVRSIRPYGGAGEVWRMIKRTAYTQLRHSLALLAGTILAMLITYVAPVVLALNGNLLAITACLLMLITYLPMVRWYGLPAVWALTLPFTAIFYIGATVASAVDYYQGKGGQWKGRVQDAPKSL